MELPETRYARSGDVSIAYQVVGEGPFDLVYVPPFASHVELALDGSRHRVLQRAACVVLAPDPIRQAGAGDVGPGRRRRLARDPHGRRPRGDGRGGIGACRAARLLRRRPHEHPVRRDLPRARVGAHHGGLVRARPLGAGLSLRQPRRGVPELRRAGRARVGNGPVLGQGRGVSRPERGRRGQASARRAAPSELQPGLGRSVCTDEHGDRRAARPLGHPGPDTRPEPSRRLSGSRGRLRLPGRAHRGLFTDIVGSTAKAAELCDSRWRELVQAHHGLIRRQLVRYRGSEIDTAGDGLFASFDGPARAIRCACAISEGVRELGLEIRAGLHTGECERIERKVGGIAVNIGSRVAAEAAPGEVLVSSTVKDLVAGSGIAFRDLGVAELRGVPGEWRLFAVDPATTR